MSVEKEDAFIAEDAFIGCKELQNIEVGEKEVTVKTEEEKLSAIAEILRQSMSVARTEKYIETLLAPPEEGPKTADVGAFLNSLNASLQKIQKFGIGAVSERRETDTQIVLTITIPK